MTERNLDLSIELVNSSMFRVEIYDPESGDHARASFDDSDVAELKSFLADEILGWVNIMRDDEEAQVAEKFARHEHEKAMSKESDPTHKVIFEVIDCDDKPAVYMYIDLARFQKEWAKDDACVPMLDDRLIHAEVDGIVYHGETFLDAMNAIGYAHGWRF